MLDDSDKKPGWKYNEWEMKGVPLRIEVGPKDVEKKAVMLARRDNGEKESVSLDNLNQVSEVLEDIQNSLFTKAKDFMDSSIVEVDNYDDLTKAISEGKIAFAQWCGSKESEERIKEATGGKSLNSPLDKKASGKCVECEEKATCYSYLVNLTN